MSNLTTEQLARSSLGRIVLHLIALSRNGAIRFHTAGILRECRIRFIGFS
jgi:hypothetical protein